EYPSQVSTWQSLLDNYEQYDHAHSGAALLWIRTCGYIFLSDEPSAAALQKWLTHYQNAEFVLRHRLLRHLERQYVYPDTLLRLRAIEDNGYVQIIIDDIHHSNSLQIVSPLYNLSDPNLDRRAEAESIHDLIDVYRRTNREQEAAPFREEPDFGGGNSI